MTFGSQPTSVLQSKSEWERLFDLSHDLFCIAGFDGYFKRVNLAFEETLGYSRKELLSRPYLDIVHPDDLQSSRDTLADLQRGKDVIGFVNRVICADGSVRWLEWNTWAVPDEDFVYGVARDVTDRRHAEADLREAQRMVEVSRDEFRLLAEEQAALRRVATLVARRVPPNEVFAVVAEEVGRVVHVPIVNIVRYEADGTAAGLASFSERGVLIPVGTRFSLEGTNVVAEVRENGRPARIDDYSGLEGMIAETAIRAGIRSTVGIPIVVAERLWGAMVVSSTAPERLPEGTEARLAGFTELAATAISNAESRAALGLLADEQAALRRVATLVARGVQSEKLFAAVTEEVGQLLPVTSASMGRYEPDGMFTTVAAWSTGVVSFPVGSRWIPEGTNVTTIVFETGRTARMDNFADASGPVGIAAREAGYRSAVGTPIIVEDRLWGVMTAASSAEDPLPPGMELRLAEFTELVATAIANAESRAQLTASRARIVAASDEARRRIERDLHDGAQQRLVSLVLELRAAERRVPSEMEELKGDVSRMTEDLESLLDDLREMSRGIHPAILAEGGLGPALKTLARRAPIPVEVDVRAETRLPEPIEVAAYYVASEALTNAIRYAQASVVRVTLEEQDGGFRLSIRDDGVGGADPRKGSGLIGLHDRVEAFGGSIVVSSAVGEGTLIAVEFPLQPGATMSTTELDKPAS